MLVYIYIYHVSFFQLHVLQGMQFIESINAADMICWSKTLNEVKECKRDHGNIKLGLFCGCDINCGITTSWTRTISPIIIIVCLNLLLRPDSPSKPFPEIYFCTFVTWTPDIRHIHACSSLSSNVGLFCSAKFILLWESAFKLWKLSRHQNYRICMKK